MRKVSNLFKKMASFVLVLALLLSTLPTGVFADGANDPKIIGVVMNETRTYITLRFDREIEAAVSSFTGRIKLSKEGKSLTALPSGTKVTISGYNMYLTLSTAITTSDNYFSINAGTLVGQKEAIESAIFDARGPELADVNQITTSPSEQTITIKFKKGIKGYPNNDSLKNGYITLARSGSSFNEKIPSEDITVNTSENSITIYLDEWLTGSRARIRFAAGKVQDSVTGNINLADLTTDYIDASETAENPEIDYIDVNADRNIITVYFTSKIKNAYTTGVSSTSAITLLKSHVWIGRGSSSKYETLGAADNLSVGSNYLKITLSEPLTASRNYLKIDKTSLTDYYGNYIFEDIVTDNFTSGTSTNSATPAYASAYLASNKKIVVYFTTTVQKNPDITTAQLRENIKISRNGGTYEELTSSDSVTFSETAMTITLRNALSGSGNRVKIAANSIASKSGVVLSSTVTTSSLVAGMDSDSSSTSSPSYDYDYNEDPPEYRSMDYEESVKRVRIYFDCDISKVSSANFNENIYVSRNGGSYEQLTSNDTVLISPSNALTILLDEPLSGSKNTFRIVGNTIANYESRTAQKSTITTDSISASQSEVGSTVTDTPSTSTPTESATYTGNVVASISDDLYSVTLKFDEPIYNNLSSLDDLKAKIQLSRNGTFKSLTSDDYIRVDSDKSELFIMFAEPIVEYDAQIKILSNALRNMDGESYNKAITTLPLSEAKGSARAYIDNKAIANALTAETSGNKTTATVSDSSKFASYTKAVELLVKVPSTSDEATVNFDGSVVNAIKANSGTLALSLGDATYYIPTKNISTISSGDTLSISIENADAAIKQKLSSEASSNSFKIESPAKKLTAKIITAAGATQEITHTSFAEKRFMLSNPTTEQTSFSIVRIEDSGAVVPVPSSNEVVSGVVYITAKTLSDGTYAAISSSRSISIVSWVENPANVLSSRYILTYAPGSTVNGNEAISRSEAATIMARTLGIVVDTDEASPFFDIISSDNYYTSIMSSYKHGLIAGMPDGTFKPEKQLTRAEAMTIVARAMRFMKGNKNIKTSDMTTAQATSVLSKFTDAATVDDWAKANIAECVQAEVVKGDNHGNLNPKSNVTRAEFIQLMYNVLNTSNLL